MLFFFRLVPCNALWSWACPFYPTGCKVSNVRFKFFAVQRAAMVAFLTGWRMIKGLTRKFLSLLPKHICLNEPENRARESPQYTNGKTKLNRAWTSQVKAPVSGWARTKSKLFPQCTLCLITYSYPKISWPLFKNIFLFCMYECFLAYMCVCAPCACWCSQRPEEGVQLPGTRAMDACTWTCRYQELNLYPPQAVSVLNCRVISSAPTNLF